MYIYSARVHSLCTHRIKNVSPGLIFGGLIFGRIFMLRYRGSIFGPGLYSGFLRFGSVCTNKFSNPPFLKSSVFILAVARHIVAIAIVSNI